MLCYMWHMVSHWLSRYVTTLVPSHGILQRILALHTLWSPKFFNHIVWFIYRNIKLDSLVYSEFNLSQLGEPTATSSPAKPVQPKTSRQHHKINFLRGINVNFQSIKNKKPELDQIISSVKHDIILGTETWLSPDISSYEYIPDSDYTVCRRYRPAN